MNDIHSFIHFRYFYCASSSPLRGIEPATFRMVDVLFVCSSDVNKIQEGIGDKISNFLQWFASFVSGIVIGFSKGWKLTLVILSVSPLLAIAGGMMTYVSSNSSSSPVSQLSSLLCYLLGLQVEYTMV